MNREQWLTERRKGIGGSDSAAILGFSPWKTAMDVWLEKVGAVPERPFDPDKDFLRDLGTQLEPVIARLYERETGNEIMALDPLIPIVQHREYAELIGTPDRLGRRAYAPDASLAERFGVELKTENQFTDLFGDPGSDQVPQHYLIQCAHYMAVCNLPRWDVAVLHGGTRFNVYHIERDSELESEMVNQLRAWWRDHVVTKTPPPVDASDGWRRYLHARHPVETSAELVKADQPAAQLLYNLGRIRDAEKNLEALRDETENQIKAAIGDATGITSEYGRVTWKKTKDAEHIDWCAVAGALAIHYGTHEEMFNQFAKDYTTTRPGVRRLYFSPTKAKHGKHAISNEQAGNALPDAAPDAVTGNGERSVGGASESTN